MAYVYIGDQKVTLDTSKVIGKGGEADIYNIGNQRALKLFKPSSHPDYEGQPHEQQGAQRRLEIHQTKLRQFPANLPPGIIKPLDLAYYPKNFIAGYTMQLIQGAELLARYCEPDFRRSVSNDDVRDIFLDLHQNLFQAHKVEFVLGDFNDLNILVKDKHIYVIDADSAQFGGYFCSTFTTKFIDPLNIRATTDKEKQENLNIGSIIMCKPHNKLSDWYAFAVLLMQSLLYVDPYGGVYKPQNKAKAVIHNERPLHHITVFNPEVKYPKPAIHFRVLPDDLLEFFQKTFEKDYRVEFPKNLLENLNWTNCSNCGTLHARSVCPNCKFAAPAAVKEVIIIRGQVKSTTIFQLSGGHILYAAFQAGKLNWIYHQNNQFKREDDSVVIGGSIDPAMRFRIQNEKTLIGKGNQVIVLNKNKSTEKILVDTYGTLPMFDANEKHLYWSSQGGLMKSGDIAPDYIGDVLADQTLFWVGQNFGFGFYRAGEIQIAFVFNANSRGINDSLKIPRISGQLIDSTCVFAKDKCWFFTSVKNSGRTINTCSVIKSDGSIEATIHTDAGDGSWLSQIRGKCAAGNFLLSATDDGLNRLEVVNGKIEITREFPDTEPFVNINSNLFVGIGGIYVVDDKSIKFLEIK